MPELLIETCPVKADRCQDEAHYHEMLDEYYWFYIGHISFPSGERARMAECRMMVGAACELKQEF